MTSLPADRTRSCAGRGVTPRCLRPLRSIASVHLVLFLLLEVGCVGLWHRVDRSLLDQVPNEEKLLLFDAENGVYIAKDEMETAERAWRDAERALARAARYRETIQERRKSGAAIDTPQVLALLDEWNEARTRMRRAEVAFVRQKRATAEARLWASRARYERAKALLVKDFNPEGGTSIQVADFDAQVTEMEAREKEQIDLLAAREKEVSDERAIYNELSAKLQALSNGAYGGPWADLVD